MSLTKKESTSSIQIFFFPLNYQNSVVFVAGIDIGLRKLNHVQSNIIKLSAKHLSPAFIRKLRDGTSITKCILSKCSEFCR